MLFSTAKMLLLAICKFSDFSVFHLATGIFCLQKKKPLKKSSNSHFNGCEVVDHDSCFAYSYKCVCMCDCRCKCATVHLWRSEDSLGFQFLLCMQRESAFQFTAAYSRIAGPVSLWGIFFSTSHFTMATLITGACYCVLLYAGSDDLDTGSHTYESSPYPVIILIFISLM